MYPSDLIALFHYTTHDLLQLQHLSISCLLFSAGVLEFSQSQMWLTRPQWSMLWCCNMCYVGLVFFAHEQHSYWATLQHVTLGFAMVTGAILFGRVKEGLIEQLRHEHLKQKQRIPRQTHIHSRRKQNGARYESVSMNGDDAGGGMNNSDDHDPAPNEDSAGVITCNLVLSGLFFSTAAAILILFRDHSHGQHTGTSTYCQPAWPLTFGGYILSIFTLTFTCITLSLFSPRCTLLVNRCCPTDERSNIWCWIVNTCLCISSIHVEESQDDHTQTPSAHKQHSNSSSTLVTIKEEDEDDHTANGISDSASLGVASRQMLRVVAEKEEEERREKIRALQRLKEVEQMLARDGH